MAFPKGVSGNPGGRPKGVMASVQEVCGKDGKALITALWTIANNDAESTRDRLTAIKELLDRGWGKPVQEVAFDPEAPAVLKIELTDAPTPDPEHSLS